MEIVPCLTALADLVPLYPGLTPWANEFRRSAAFRLPWNTGFTK